MVQRVFEGALAAKHISRLIIATDDERIRKTCQAFGAEVWMTSPDHNSGTERVAEVAERIDIPIVINIQGDEPLIKGETIDELVGVLQDEAIPMATAAAKVDNLSGFGDENTVKAVFDKEGFALYFSRSPLPYQAKDYFHKHIGIYGYQRDFLLRFNKRPRSRLERTENLEQLRALEDGVRIKVIESPHLTLSVDSPQDIIKVEKALGKREDE
jgi:3-deoxy-manno-octulosonate cytidylyltransferase (CMP-KDO synthetase)